MYTCVRELVPIDMKGNKMKSKQFEDGEVVIFDDGTRTQIGIVKRKAMIPNHYFVYYSTGDTAASTDASYLRRVENGYAFKRRKN